MNAKQELPVEGRENVTPVAGSLFATMLAEAEQRGIASYGTTLQTHNGRDVFRDLLEEIVDMWQYAVQAKMESADARAALAAAEARASELTSMLQAREAQRDEALARVDEEHQRAERLAAVVQAQIDAKQIEWEDQLTVTPKMIADNLGWSLAAPGWEQEKAAWLGLLPGDVKDGHYER